MPTTESLPHLAGVYDGLAEAMEYAKSGKEYFLGSRENQAAIMFRLLCVGESAKQFCDENLPSKRPRGTKRIDHANPDVAKVGLSPADWQQLFDIRDHLAHELQTLDKERVWKLLETNGGSYRDSVFQALKHCASGWLSTGQGSDCGGDSVIRAKRDLNEHFMAQFRSILDRFNEPSHSAIKRASEAIQDDMRRQLQEITRSFLRGIPDNAYASILRQKHEARPNLAKDLKRAREVRSSSSPLREPMEFVGNFYDRIEDAWKALSSEDEVMLQIGKHVLVYRTGSVISTSPLTVRWLGHVPTVFFDFARAVGDQDATELDREHLVSLVKKAEHARKSSFRRCSICGELTPPEHRVEGRCHACFERAGGVF